MILRKWLTVLLMITFMLCMSMGALSAADGAWDGNGPYVDEIIMPIITDSEARYLALLRGEIDIYPDVNRPSDIRSFAADPRIDLTMTPGLHMFYMGFNLQREPLDDPVLRRAMAHLVDRESLVFSVFDGYVFPLAEAVPESSPFYHRTAHVAEYDPQLAERLLNEAGYVRGEDGIRVDPRTSKPLRTLTLITPTYEESPTSAEVAVRLAQTFQNAGIPVAVVSLEFNTMVERLLRKDPVTEERDFDLFVSGWGLARYPLHLYTLFHSSFDVNGGNNVTGLRDAAYDAAAEKLWRPRTLEQAYEAAAEAQEIWAALQPYIPIYSLTYIDAFRSDRVTGYVEHVGYGAASNPLASPWTALNIRRVDQPEGRGGSIRWLLFDDPGTLNILASYTAFEDQVLGLIYDSLITANPETNEDYPWLATSWVIDTWTTESGEEGSVITYQLAEGVTWHDGVPFTAYDVKFTMDYLKEKKPPNLQAVWQDYSHSIVHDDLTVSVYYNTVSYWHTYATGGFLAEHIWSDVNDYESFQPWREPHPEVEGLTKLIGHGPFVFKEWVPGEYIRLVRNESYWRSQG